jgi:hypothetical protein
VTRPGPAVQERKTYTRLQACLKGAFINEDHRCPAVQEYRAGGAAAATAAWAAAALGGPGASGGVSGELGDSLESSPTAAPNPVRVLCWV